MVISPSLIVIFAVMSSICWLGRISDFALKSISAFCLPSALMSIGSVDQGDPLEAVLPAPALAAPASPPEPLPPEPVVVFDGLGLVEGAMNGVRLTVPPLRLATIIGLVP